MTAAPPPSTEDTAALWVARLRAGQLSAGRQAELDSWLRADPAHAVSFASYCEDSATLDASLLVLKSEGLAVEAEPLATAPRPVRWLVPAAALGLAAALAFLLWPAAAQPLNTPPGQRLTLSLGDGSQVELNANTTGTFRADRTSRTVILTSGEALFTVTKNPDRPFFVKTATGTVRVTGTVFDVRAPGPQDEEVTVLEGRVEVTALAAPTAMAVLQAGDQARLYGAAPVVRPLSPQAMERATAWRRGLLEFDAEPLRSAIQRMASYHGIHAEVSPQLDGMTLGGSYELADLEAFLKALEQILPLKVVRGDQGNIRLVPR